MALKLERAGFIDRVGTFIIQIERGLAVCASLGAHNKSQPRFIMLYIVDSPLTHLIEYLFFNCLSRASTTRDTKV